MGCDSRLDQAQPSEEFQRSVVCDLRDRLRGCSIVHNCSKASCTSAKRIIDGSVHSSEQKSFANNFAPFPTSESHANNNRGSRSIPSQPSNWGLNNGRQRRVDHTALEDAAVDLPKDCF